MNEGGSSSTGFSLWIVILHGPKTRKLKCLCDNCQIFVGHGFTGRGKSRQFCHPERSEGSAFSPTPGKKQIPRANPALGMTVLEFFRSLFSRAVKYKESIRF
jgi:hypothetical protein